MRSGLIQVSSWNFDFFRIKPNPKYRKHKIHSVFMSGSDRFKFIFIGLHFKLETKNNDYFKKINQMLVTELYHLKVLLNNLITWLIYMNQLKIKNYSFLAGNKRNWWLLLAFFLNFKLFQSYTLGISSRCLCVFL